MNLFVNIRIYATAHCLHPVTAQLYGSTFPSTCCQRNTRGWFLWRGHLIWFDALPLSCKSSSQGMEWHFLSLHHTVKHPLCVCACVHAAKAAKCCTCSAPIGSLHRHTFIPQHAYAFAHFSSRTLSDFEKCTVTRWGKYTSLGQGFPLLSTQKIKKWKSGWPFYIKRVQKWQGSMTETPWRSRTRMLRLCSSICAPVVCRHVCASAPLMM